MTATLDTELRELTAAHPGLAARTAPARRIATRTARKGLRRAGRRTGRTIARGWARVRGCLGSLAGLSTATVAAFQFGTVPGLLSAAVAFVVAEWLVK